MKTSAVIEALGALAHEHRLAVFRLLVERGPEGMPAGAIGERIGLVPSSLTFHLQALQRTPSLAGADITVHSREGFVTLSGVARTVKDIARAGKIALGVRGVIGVSNELRTADRESRG